jgi:hypothetical protein
MAKKKRNKQKHNHHSNHQPTPTTATPNREHSTLDTKTSAAPTSATTNDSAQTTPYTTPELQPELQKASAADTHPQADLMNAEPVAAAVAPAQHPPNPINDTEVSVLHTTAAKTSDSINHDTANEASTKKSGDRLFLWIAGSLLVIAIIAVWFRLERDGQLDTGVFDSILAAQEASTIVAIVNNEVLRSSQKTLSVEQLTQEALANGVDPTDPVVAAEIDTVATDMLINTTLLLQTAERNGVTLTTQDIEARLAQLQEGAGGADALNERMQAAGISEEMLRKDIETELAIVKLLNEEVLSNLNQTITEEEIEAIYNQVAGGTENAPTLAEARAQIEAQILQAREAEAVTNYVDSLRAIADIEVI